MCEYLRDALTWHHDRHFAGVDDQQHRAVHVDVVAENGGRLVAYVDVQVAEDGPNYGVGQQSGQQN